MKTDSAIDFNVKIETDPTRENGPFQREPAFDLVHAGRHRQRQQQLRQGRSRHGRGAVAGISGGLLTNAETVLAPAESALMSRAGARALRAARGVVAETSSVFLSSGLDRPMAPDRFSLGEIGRRVPMFIQAFRSLSLAYAYERMIPALWLTWPRLSFLGPWPARTAVPQPLCLTFPVCAGRYCSRGTFSGNKMDGESHFRARVPSGHSTRSIS
jgi:hypothetical protein